MISRKTGKSTFSKLYIAKCLHEYGLKIPEIKKEKCFNEVKEYFYKCGRENKLGLRNYY